MCKFADLRYAEMQAEDDNWIATRYYSVTFNGWRGFFDTEWRSQMTSWGPEKYDGKQYYWCQGCVNEYDSFHEAQLHLDEDSDHNPDVLSWFGLE